MKRTILLLLCCIFALHFLSLPIAAQSLDMYDAANAGYSVFEAWNMEKYSGYDFYINKYESPYRIAYNKQKNDWRWHSLLAAWRFATLNLTSELQYAEKEIGYYDSFIYNILFDETTQSLSSSFLSALSDEMGDAKSTWKSIQASLLKTLCDFDKGLLKEKLKVNLSELTDEECAAYQKCFKTNAELSSLFKCLKNADDVFKYGTTIADLVDKCAQASALLNCTKETADILSYMASLSSESTALKLALTQTSEIVTETMKETQILLLLGSECTMENCLEILTDNAYNSIIKALGTYGLAVKAGQKAGKLLVHELFGTDEVIAAYYEMDAMCKFENLMISVTRNMQSKFDSDPTIENAKHFTAATKMLYKTYIAAIDVTKKYFEVSNTHGLLTDLFYGADETYDSLMKNLEQIKKNIQFTLDFQASYTETFYNDVLEEIAAIAADLAGLVSYPVDETAYQEMLAIVETDSFSMSNPVLKNDLTLEDDIEVYGSLTMSSGTLDLNGHTFIVHGDVIENGGTIDLNGGTMTVGGDFLQRGGTLYIHCGTLDIVGDYALADSLTKNADGSRTYDSYSDGYLRMDTDADVMRVGGCYGAYAYYGQYGYLTAGTLYISGNFYQIAKSGTSYGERSFPASGTHTVVLNGTRTQHIYFDTYNNSYFNNVVFENKNIQLDSGISGFTVEEDMNLTIATNNFGVKGTLNLNGHVPTWTANDLTLSSGKIIFGGTDLIVNGSLTFAGCSIDLGKSNLSVSGNVTLYGGTIDLNGGTMTVGGDFLQRGGTLYIHCGTLDIVGDYALADSLTKNADGSRTYDSYSDGYLRMDTDADVMRVGGCYGAYAYYGQYGYLTAGTLYISGNFYQIAKSGTSYGERSFPASGTHTVVLNGTRTQHIYFDSYDSSHFNILKLTQDISNYTFSPEKCWNSLITSKNGATITTVPASTKASLGGTVSYYVYISGTFDGFAFYLTAPDGMTVESVVPASPVGGSAISANHMADGRWLVSVMGNCKQTDAADTLLATITLSVSTDAAVGDRTLSLEDIAVSDTKGDPVTAVKTVYGTLTVVDYIPGDINDDGVFDYYDVTKLYAYFCGKTTTDNTSILDVNGDGTFDYFDVAKLYAVYRGDAVMP